MATTNDQAVINLGRLETYNNKVQNQFTKVDNHIDMVEKIATAAIETHTGSGVPTLTNKPASDWGDPKYNASVFKTHIGDLYYDSDTGYAYRFVISSDDVFSWQRISDSDVTKAINDADAAKKAAEAAQTTANNKIDKVVAGTGIRVDHVNNGDNKNEIVNVAYLPGGGLAIDSNSNPVLKVDTSVIATKASVNAKQDKLTAGDNVTIDGNVISAKDTVYTLPPATAKALGGIKVGANLSIAADGTLSAAKQSTDISGKQDKLTAGNGIALDGATISAKPVNNNPIFVNNLGIGIVDGTTTAKGAVRLSDATDSLSLTEAATANAVKKTYDLAKGKQNKLTFATDDDINAMFAAS